MKFIKSLLRNFAGHLPAEEVKWVVNDLAELGVRIGDTCYFLYKGESLVYGGYHDDGSPMHWRPVRKREFGEVCRPPGFEPQLRDDNGVYFEGDGWFPLTSKA